MAGAYDLDEAPVVILSSRWKSAVGVIGWLIFLVWFFQRGYGPTAPLMLAQSFGAAAGLVLFAFPLVIPNRLVIEPAGMTVSGILGTRTWRWSQVGDFKTISRPRQSDVVGFNLTEKNHRFDPTETADRTLPGGWPLTTDDLAELLNGASNRWA